MQRECLQDVPAVNGDVEIANDTKAINFLVILKTFVCIMKNESKHF